MAPKIKIIGKRSRSEHQRSRSLLKDQDHNIQRSRSFQKDHQSDLDHVKDQDLPNDLDLFK